MLIAVAAISVAAIPVSNASIDAFSPRSRRPTAASCWPIRWACTGVANIRQAKHSRGGHRVDPVVHVARKIEPQPKVAGHSEVFVVKKQMLLDRVGLVADVDLFARFAGIDLLADDFQ